MQTIRLFVDVARCHSFSQAAVLHGVSQSAASQRIHQLEKNLGITLIDRSQRPLRLTEAGERFFIGCQDIIERYDRLEHSINKLRDQPAGVVRVAAIYSAGIELLHDVRERFAVEFPQIEIELTYEHPETIHEMVREHQVDLGIVSYPEHWKGLGNIPLRDEAMALVCPAKHPLANRDVVTPDMLSGHPMICLESGLPIGRKVRQYLRDHGATPRIIESFDNIDTIKGAVAATGHLAILPARTVLREVALGSLACVNLGPPLTRPMGIIYRKRAGKQEAFGPAAKAFVENLVRRATDDAAPPPPPPEVASPEALAPKAPSTPTLAEAQTATAE